MTEPDHSVHSPFVRDHWWWRPGWHQGRRAYTFHVIFNDGQVDGVDSLHHLVREYQAAVASLSGLDAIPIEWLHLTVQGVGFVDDVSDQDVDTIADAVRERCAALPPFDLTFGRAIIADEGIMLRASPPAPLRALRGAMRSGIAAVWGTANVPEDEAFTPHVSIAYSNADSPTDSFVQALDTCRVEPAVLTVHGASLIVLDRDARVYRWTRRALVPLGR